MRRKAKKRQVKAGREKEMKEGKKKKEKLTMTRDIEINM